MYTRKRVRDFLSNHTCYELIPESGKVVLLDIDLPVRQAFHALHEQGVASAPLWDSEAVAVVGMISASDFIHLLRRLRSRWAISQVNATSIQTVVFLSHPASGALAYGRVDMVGKGKVSMVCCECENKQLQVSNVKVPGAAL